MIVSEANALGTAWLRADVLPEPQRAELKAALKEYTADRVTILSSRDRDEIVRLVAKVGGLHERMWAAALAGTQGDAPTMNLVLPPLNEVFDLHTSAPRLGDPAPAAADPDRAADDGGDLPGAGRRRQRAFRDGAFRCSTPSMPSCSPSPCG